MEDFNKVIIDECFKKIKAFISKDRAFNAKTLIDEMKSTYPEENVVEMLGHYLNIQTYYINAELKVLDWNWEKSKIQEKIDNFNKKEKLEPFPTVNFYMYDYLKTKRTMTQEEIKKYSNIVLETENLVKLSEEVRELYRTLKNKYTEKTKSNTSFATKIKNLFSKK